MMRTLLIRGLLVGVVAGALVFLVATLLGEPSLNAGISFEEARTAATGGADEPEVVSRAVQSTVGLALGSLVYGTTVGGLFAIAYAVAQGRLGRLGVRGTALTVALGGFLAVGLLPALKYPANPPGSNDAATIDDRTRWYFLMMAVSVLVVVGTAVLARALARRLGSWNAGTLAVLAGVGAVAVAYLVLPGVDETPAGFPADVLWEFRLASIGLHLAAWAAIGLLFGTLTARALGATSSRRPSAPAPDGAPVVSRG